MLGSDWKRLSSAIVCIVLLAFTSIICIPSTSSADVLAFGLDPLAVGFAQTFGGIGGNGNIIDFAVLRPNSAFDNILGSSYQPAVGSPAFDPSKWTYLYQVANASSGNPPSTLQTFGFNPIQQSGIPNLATSVGTFGNNAGNLRFDFTNQGSIVNAQGNNLQSVNAFGINSSLVANNNIINVSTSSLPHGSSGLIWNFSTGNSSPILNGIQNGNTSPLFGYQSDASPSISSNLGPVLNGVIATSAGFQAVTPIAGAFNVAYAGVAPGSGAPEPSTMLLIGSGLAGLVSLRRKRQIQKTEAS